jgi:uridine phosphorylase
MKLIFVFKEGIKMRVVTHEPDLAAGRKTAVALTAAADELRAIAPVAGSYVSEDYFFNQSRC